MTTTLSHLEDSDGLVSLQQVTINPAQPREMLLKETGQKVFVPPITFGVVDFVVPRTDLTPSTKLKLLETQKGLKRMPIYGVQFDVGLAKAREARPGTLIKSMYKATQPNESAQFGNCATLVAHIQKTSEHVQIEAWQITALDAETFYLHGILDPEISKFIHLDGATMHHETQAADKLFQYGTKIKGTNYQKWFRLDGSIAKADAVAIAKAYFPLESLIVEYVEQHEAQIDN